MGSTTTWAAGTCSAPENAQCLKLEARERHRPKPCLTAPLSPTPGERTLREEQISSGQTALCFSINSNHTCDRGTAGNHRLYWLEALLRSLVCWHWMLLGGQPRASARKREEKEEDFRSNDRVKGEAIILNGTKG